MVPDGGMSLQDHCAVPASTSSIFHLLQAPGRLNAYCSMTTYPPTSVPNAWRQQHQPLLADQDLLVPDLPDLSKVVGPVQQVRLPTTYQKTPPASNCIYCIYCSLVHHLSCWQPVLMLKGVACSHTGCWLTHITGCCCSGVL